MIRIDVKDQVYWCDCCDLVQVDSNDPATGFFFSQFGHAQRLNDEWVQVTYALCVECASRIHSPQFLSQQISLHPA